MHDSDTIVALASGAGRAAVAIVRVSGPQVRFITETIAGNLPTPNKTVLRVLRQPGTRIALDEALILYFKAPRSFTGEDIVEFHCHGSRAVVTAVLDSITSLRPDIRLAGPGEFARRAFLNGKMDLSAIEGLGDLIDSETEWQRRQAMRQMDGELGRLVESWRDKLLQAMALIEASLDFSDEGDVEVGIETVLANLTCSILSDMRNVLRHAGFGESVREGFRIVIAGPPNAGKSSLLNAIAKRDVAIVSDLPGTTRDVIELRCDIGGYPVIFSDTAGLRRTSDRIEQLGIDRARQEISGADLVLNLRAVDEPLVEIIEPEAIVLNVATKIDIAGPDFTYDLAVSATTGVGLDVLLQTVRQKLDELGGGETALIANARQRHALHRAIEPLERLAASLASPDVSTISLPELMAEELRQSARALDQLVGRIDVEMVLDTLFARFCIGK